LANQIKNGEQVIPLLVDLLKTGELAFDLGLTSSGFGGLTGVVPKIRLGGFPLEFFQFSCQSRNVKDTSEIPECSR
jgi:hypothetical protein